MHSLFYPSQYVGSLLNVDARALRDLGIRGVLLDLDNTLVPWRSTEIGPDMESWVRSALTQGLKICIVSNTWRRERIDAIAQRVGVPYILRAGKPRRGSLTRGMQTIGTQPAETAVIGDQIFTDVIGGNRIGAYTILCAPIPGREFLGTNLVRALERFLMHRLARQGRLAIPAMPGDSGAQAANDVSANTAPRDEPNNRSAAQEAVDDSGAGPGSEPAATECNTDHPCSARGSQ